MEAGERHRTENPDLLKKETHMAKVNVYYFTKYYINTDQMVRSLRPATREVIAKIEETVLLEETAQEVDESQLEDGFYTPGTGGIV